MLELGERLIGVICGFRVVQEGKNVPQRLKRILTELLWHG
jgi:hypothetical protein